MKRPEPSTPAIRSCNSSRRGAYCALTSISGIATRATLPFGRRLQRPAARSPAQEAHDDVDDACADDGRHGVVGVAPLLVEVLPARPDGHPDAREGEAP